VGKARDLRARLRSYFQSARQRPSVEAALDEVTRVEWRITGSELAAALEEIRLIRELRPPANSRTPTPERYVYLHRRGERVVLSAAPSRYGPLRGRAEAQRAAHALKGCTEAEFDALLAGAPFDRIRRRVVELFEIGHDLDASRLRRELASLERIHARLVELERLRKLEICILAPALEHGTFDAYVISAGRVSVERGGSASSAPGEQAAVIEADRLDQLSVAASFLDAPPPELRLIPLDRSAAAA
jgi:hypothetical protein